MRNPDEWKVGDSLETNYKHEPIKIMSETPKYWFCSDGNYYSKKTGKIRGNMIGHASYITEKQKRKIIFSNQMRIRQAKDE
jgi:hypothetical protein